MDIFVIRINKNNYEMHVFIIRLIYAVWSTSKKQVSKLLNKVTFVTFNFLNSLHNNNNIWNEIHFFYNERYNVVTVKVTDKILQCLKLTCF